MVKIIRIYAFKVFTNDNFWCIWQTVLPWPLNKKVWLFFFQNIDKIWKYLKQNICKCIRSYPAGHSASECWKKEILWPHQTVDESQDTCEEMLARSRTTAHPWKVRGQYYTEVLSIWWDCYLCSPTEWKFIGLIHNDWKWCVKSWKASWVLDTWMLPAVMMGYKFSYICIPVPC